MISQTNHAIQIHKTTAQNGETENPAADKPIKSRWSSSHIRLISPRSSHTRKIIMPSSELWKIQQARFPPHFHQTSSVGRRGNGAPINLQLPTQASRYDHLFTVNLSHLHPTTREKSSCHSQNSGSYSIFVSHPSSIIVRQAPSDDVEIVHQLTHNSWHRQAKTIIPSTFHPSASDLAAHQKSSGHLQSFRRYSMQHL